MTGRPQGVAASTFRPRLMFEVASEMVGAQDWPFRSARLSMRDQGATETDVFSMMATQDPAIIDEVERGEVHASMLNPSAMLTMAVRGTGPFDRPRAISAIAVTMIAPPPMPCSAREATSVKILRSRPV